MTFSIFIKQVMKRNVLFINKTIAKVVVVGVICTNLIYNHVLHLLKGLSTLTICNWMGMGAQVDHGS
jgi:hypothetical protein